MSPRTERARFLGDQLATVMDALATETQGADVVHFLDRLARLEAYPQEELAEVPGLRLLIDEATAARTEHLDELARLAGAVFDLDELLHRGRHLGGGDAEDDRDAWLRDVLLVATVAPWFTPARRRLAQWAMESATAMIDAEAGAFLDASSLAFDRYTLEAPDGLGEEARGILDVLIDIPLLVAVDRSESRPDTHRLTAALRSVDSGLLAAADDALADHEERGVIRLPAPATGLRLAAAGSETAVLVRMWAGAWLVHRRAADLRLSFEGEPEELSVVVEAGPRLGTIPRDPDGSYPLPRSSGPLVLRLGVGPDSRRVHLDPHEGPA